MKAITIRQPWAWLLIHGPKDIENRNWLTRYQGPIAIHAAKGITAQEWHEARGFVLGIDLDLFGRIPTPDKLIRGAIIGTMNVADCVTESKSPWFHGKYGIILNDPKPIEPVYVKGQLGIWDWPA